MSVVDTIFNVLPLIRTLPAEGEDFKVFDHLIKDFYSTYDGEIFKAGDIEINWKRKSLGNIDSFGFYTLAEFMLYKYYELNKNKYSTVFDVGANTGIDSIILSKLGYNVHAFEPDPYNVEILKKNISENNLADDITIHENALSDKRGKAEFTRVMGNITASHISSARECYGETETFEVDVMQFEDIGVVPDLMKINIEGSEKHLIPSIPVEVWEHCDAFIELHSEEDRQVIFDFFTDNNINIFANRIGWNKAEKVEDLATSYREGYIFITKNDVMSW